MSDQIFYYSWQNPLLRETIYITRNQKLRDFLLAYREIDLLKQFRAENQPEGDLVDGLKVITTELEAEHKLVDDELEKAIAKKAQSDKWFGAIKAINEKNLRFKRIYYLDRQITELTEEHADLLSQQESLRKRVEWYSEGDTRRNLWETKAKELDAPIAAVLQKLGEVKYLRDLFDRQALLPRMSQPGSVDVQTAVRWELHKYSDELGSFSHDKLIPLVIKCFDDEPERFEKWLQYMVIHFSGMRYKSAHGSWADPKYLLELLTREMLKNEINAMDNDSLTKACESAIAELQSELPNFTDENKIKAVQQQISNIRFFTPRRALLDYRMGRAIGEIQNMPDNEDIFLSRLERLKKEKDDKNDPIPEWAWKEIEKYTPLRLKTQEKSWEDTSSERWKWENQRWREILNTWERKDITGWRKRHADTLELIVTRAVCNEVAEHIQHLRGWIPSGGLTSKPKWYLNMQKFLKVKWIGHKDPVYLKQAPVEEDFRNGASILWLEWVDIEPNAWQVAHPVTGYKMPPEGVSIHKNKTTDTVEWSFHQINDTFIRTRRRPTIKELRDQGISIEEIEAIRAEMQEKGGFVTQYLRWTHEATVIGVEEMVDGKYVLTYETYRTGLGLIRRSLYTLVGNPNVFVGYLPKADQESEHLAEMLQRDKILPNTSL